MVGTRCAAVADELFGSPAHLDQILVADAAESLLSDGGDFMSGPLEELDGPAAQILVQFCFQARRSSGMSTKCSRLISVP